MSNENTNPFPIAQEISKSERVLTELEKEKLQNDKILVGDFKKNKLEVEARKNWDLFYKRNSANFFKDRHWTHREFCELAPEVSSCLKIVYFVGRIQH